MNLTFIIGNVMIIRVTSVEWTWLGLEWPPDLIDVDVCCSTYSKGW